MQNIKPNNIIVSVIMITYGHDKYIKQAIEGVLMQECNFEIELILSNDCSPDNTNKVVNEIIKNHPKSNIIKYTEHKKNLGANNNFIWAISQVNGKYIALCEGDDYWIDPLKLQKQVEFLENNNDFSICFHDVNLIKESIEMPNDIEYSKNIFDIYDLAEGNFMHTCSVCYRNIMHSELNYILKDLNVGDYIVHMLNARHGKIKYLKNSMANYRIHDGGSWSLKNEKFQLEKIDDYLNGLIKLDFDKRVKKILLNRIFWANKTLLNYDFKIVRLYKILKLDSLLFFKLLIKNKFF